MMKSSTKTVLQDCVRLTLNFSQKFSVIVSDEIMIFNDKLLFIICVSRTTRHPDVSIKAFDDQALFVLPLLARL